MQFDLFLASEVLERTPKTICDMLGGLPSDWTDPNEGPETWSAYTNVGHLITADRHNWIPRAQAIVAQSAAKVFTPFDRFTQFRESEGKGLPELLDDFIKIRHESLSTLRGMHLTSAQLELQGVHPAFGPVTLKQHLSAWVAHDLGHIAQIARVMAKQYRDAVGPWRAYLPIMDR